jgi:uncharacterized protein YebE (UPF0316 family)
MSVLADVMIIFTLRLLDVGMATVRIVLLGRGKKGAASALGFVEALVWVAAIARVINGLDDPVRMVAFAAGFASGTYLGAKVEEWMALGQSLVRVIAPVDTPEVAPALREQGFGATVVNGDGLAGEVRVTFSVVPRKKIRDVLAMIHEVNAEAYVTVEQSESIEAPARHGRDVRK